MNGLEKILDKLANSFEGFANDLRNYAEDLPQEGAAGDGEDRDDDDGVIKFAPRAPRDNGVQDDQMVTLRSGDLRKVVDAYRKLARYAREGRIADQNVRLGLHPAVKAVKHLIRPPRG